MENSPQINEWWITGVQTDKPRKLRKPIVREKQSLEVRREKWRASRRRYVATHRDRVNAARRRYRQEKMGTRPRYAPRGIINGRSILTEDDVRVVRKLHSEKRITQRELADRFGVTSSAIGLIIRRQRWAHVE